MLTWMAAWIEASIKDSLNYMYPQQERYYLLLVTFIATELYGLLLLLRVL